MSDLGALGKAYSFSMDLGLEDNTVGHAFSAGNAVRHATLTRASGGSFIGGAPGGVQGLVIGIDHNERGVGYVYRTHGAVQHTSLASTFGHTSNDTAALDMAFSYTRDTGNHLWWAAPHHQQRD